MKDKELIAVPTPEELKNQARIKARAILAESESFRNVSQAEQFDLYKSLVDKTYQELIRQSEPAQAMSASTLNQTNPTALARQAGLATALSESNPENIKNAGDNFKNLVDKVDFPGFVRDLLNGVFNANLEANERQMEAYQKLLKEATKEVSELTKTIDDTDALMRIAENSNGKYRFDGSGGSTLFDTETNQPVPSQDNDIISKIGKVKEDLAREKRTLLRETILMGVSRLVVEKGIIRAEVEFQIEAKASTEDTSNNTNDTKSDAKFDASGGGGWGPWKAKASTNLSRTSSQVSIATAKDTTNTSASAKLKGFVEIQFKSDYFKLDNFASTFDLGKGRVDPGAAAKTDQSLPAAD